MTTDQIPFYGLCIQTGAIVVSAIGVASIIYWNLGITRRRATLDILIGEQTNETTISERTKFLTLKKSGNLSRWAIVEHEDSGELETIRAVLNRYELIAIGIKGYTLDGDLYKRWCRTTLVNDWIAAKPFVMQVRANMRFPTLFCEFEALAKEWADDTERPLV
jgi:hypothetical protein